MTHSQPFTRFAVYLCPPAEHPFYQAGSELLGYDVRRQQELTVPNYLRPEWQRHTATFGLHLTLVDAFQTDSAWRLHIEHEIRQALACLAHPSLDLTGGRVESREDGKSWVLRMQPSLPLQLLQTLLQARLSRYVTASPFDAGLGNGQWTQPEEQARIRWLRSPNTLDGWQPHFTLVRPYEGLNPGALLRKLEDLCAQTNAYEQSYHRVALFELPDGAEHWQLCQEFELPKKADAPQSQQPTPQPKKNETMKVVVATANAGKVREIAAALGELPWALEPLSIALPEETGTTYEENAAMKACAAAMSSGLPALADDSGLEVEALDGQPGVYSARYGNHSTDLDRNIYLLEKMRGQTNRRAKFVSVVILAYPDGYLESYRGEVHGTLLEGPRGTGGFGYDSLFIPDGHHHTFAEMTTTDKEVISHRGQALAALKEAYKDGAPKREISRLE